MFLMGRLAFGVSLIKAAGRADAKGINRLSNRLSIKWNQDKRNCTSIWKTENESAENIIMKGKLCDMPTIVETYKTTDKKTFYKSGTIRHDFKLKFHLRWLKI